MESRFVNVSAVRTAPTSVHFVGARSGASYTQILPQLATERSIHSLQYSIPAVQHHYGNAFDDEDDVVCGSFPIGGINGYDQSSTGGEYYNDEEDEEVDEDVEMSPAIEVISIDPNCDYDSEEEEDDDEEETVVVEQPQISSVKRVVSFPAAEDVSKHAVVQQCDQIRVSSPDEPSPGRAQANQIEEEVIEDLESDDIEPELQNLHRDSEGDCSDNESSSDSESSCSNSSRSASSGSNNSSSSSTSTASSHPSDYVPHSDPEDADMGQAENLAQIIERRKMMAIDRRKRTTSINRKSFSLPQSPVAIGTANLIHEVTSLSFEDLDMSAIVNDLSPLKSAVTRASECDDKLVDELAENNFDLAAYITEDDFGTTDSADSNANRVQKQQINQKKSPIKKQPKSRGKQIKMLRELMISPKHDTNESGGVRRSCTNKARRIVENSESESEQSESEADSKVCGKIFGMERVISKPKRKEDDVKADPTWNPNGGAPSSKPMPHRMPPGNRGTGASPASVTPPQAMKITSSESKCSVPPANPSETSKNSNTSSNKSKPLSAGSQLARNKMLSLMAKNSPLVKAHKHKSQSSGNKTRLEDKKPEPSKPKPVPASNIKLDHDYCSPKKAQKAVAAVQPRKTIEIPFLLPTMDQLRKNKKLSKNKKEMLKTSRKTGENCDKKSQKIEDISNSGSISSVDSKKPAIVPIVSSVKEEPAEAKPLQPQVPAQQKQVSLLKINLNKPNGVQTIKAEECQPVKLEPANSSSCSAENMVKVKKKLNLEEYKKRRELPMDESVVSIPVAECSSKSSLGSISNTSESSGKEELTSVIPTAQCAPAPPTEVSANAQAISRTRVPLDPISAAKLKALRMQQLKREAAIKSTEAKIIPKTVPQIVPLAEITSMQFDEHGNPIPYDKNAENDGTSTKLHDDYEEIIIVSMGSNTEVTIHPREIIEEAGKVKRPASREQDTPKNGLLSDITATIKRCQSTVPTIISSSSLISSIKEVVIKKETTIKTDAGSNGASAEKRAIGGGQANQQCSPNIGVSPNNAFSPGKPERAGGAYDDYEEGQVQSPPEEKPNKPIEHGEDKIIMHLRKDRQRSKGVSIAIQTMPLGQFPELKRLSPVKTKTRTSSRCSCGSASRSQRCADEDRGRSRRQYRKRQSRSSSSETETRNRSSNSYSRSRCSSSRRRTRSRSRSYRRRSRSDSQRRRYQERDYSRRDRCSRRRRRSRSESSDYSSGSDSSCSRSRSRSSRSLSRPSSRVSPHPRNASRTEYRRPAAVSPERKIVYVGRLEPALKREDLKRKFMQYGRIKQVTLHYKESGAKYGFVTFEKPQDAYKAIDSSSTDPNLIEYDVSFGGRRAFCRTEYADLDGDLSQNQEMPYFAPDGTVLMPPAPMAPMTRKDEGESFEDMLKKLKKEINAKKPRKS